MFSEANVPGLPGHGTPTTRCSECGACSASSQLIASGPCSHHIAHEVPPPPPSPSPHPPKQADYLTHHPHHPSPAVKGDHQPCVPPASIFCFITHPPPLPDAAPHPADRRRRGDYRLPRIARAGPRGRQGGQEASKDSPRGGDGGDPLPPPPGSGHPAPPALPRRGCWGSAVRRQAKGEVVQSPYLRGHLHRPASPLRRLLLAWRLPGAALRKGFFCQGFLRIRPPQLAEWTRRDAPYALGRHGAHAPHPLEGQRRPLRAAPTQRPATTRRCMRGAPGHSGSRVTCCATSKGGLTPSTERD